MTELDSNAFEHLRHIRIAVDAPRDDMGENEGAIEYSRKSIRGFSN
jgi:hypothetical protein